MGAGLHTALDSDLGRLWPAVSASRLFPDREEFERFYAEEPWRVLVDDDGRAVVLERWREHLDILGIKGIWCAERDLGYVLEGVRSVARERGYGRVLSALIPEEASGPYRAAGMDEAERIVALRASIKRRAHRSEAPPAGIVLEHCSPADRDDIASVDAACFDEFWRHGGLMLERSLTLGRVVAAKVSGQVMGYTWCTIDRGMGTIGRIAVAPAARRRGIGRTMLEDALDHMATKGAGVVSLCTQEHNAASRALYASCGLRELPGRLVLLMQDA